LREGDYQWAMKAEAADAELSSANWSLQLKIPPSGPDLAREDGSIYQTTLPGSTILIR
jgi:hypothetical protein